jgi:hypothetical protein
MVKRAAQGEVLGDTVVSRLEADVVSALRRKPTQEARLAGSLRALAPHSPRVRDALQKALETLVKRGTYQRPLYAAAVRALAEQGERRAVAQIKRALGSDEFGGLATLSAACSVTDSSLTDPLARIAASRHPHLAFAAEVARVARSESNGQHIASVAPKIKESHRIDLCVELFVPLLWGPALPVAIAPALAVLRDAERHLGRWLVLGEIATRAGDPKPLKEARDRAREGPTSARAAWTMVAWALGGDGEPAPSIRPTVELVARLSDRPSADRDTTFLFRLAAARVPGARPMLENMVKSSSLGDATAIRAALYLSRDHHRTDLEKMLVETMKSSRREALRGLAAAALYDAGKLPLSDALLAPLLSSRQLPTAGWAALLAAAQAGRLSAPLVTEPTFRRVQLGWVE